LPLSGLREGDAQAYPAQLQGGAAGAEAEGILARVEELGGHRAFQVQTVEGVGVSQAQEVAALIVHDFDAGDQGVVGGALNLLPQEGGVAGEEGEFHRLRQAGGQFAAAFDDLPVQGAVVLVGEIGHQEGGGEGDGGGGVEGQDLSEPEFHPRSSFSKRVMRSMSMDSWGMASPRARARGRLTSTTKYSGWRGGGRP